MSLTPTNRPSQANRNVLDPAWEESLRKGQEEAGEAGGLERELAVLHLLRHARAVESMPEPAFDELWADVDGSIQPVPWWRRSWVLWGAPVAAAAAVAIVVFSGTPPDAAVVTAESSGTSLLLEHQFSQLEPDARRVLASRVDVSRGQMRGQLLALAKGPAPSSGDTP